MTREPDPEYSIRPLDDTLERDKFICGVEPLDRYLREFASQHSRKGVSATFVLTFRENREVLGYYTLAASNIRLDRLPPTMVKKFPKYPFLPVTLLARLAVSQNHRGKGLGQDLLMDALRRSYEASKSVGSIGVVVDAKHEEAAQFYAKYGFVSVIDDPMHLFMSMKAITDLWSAL